MDLFQYLQATQAEDHTKTRGLQAARGRVRRASPKVVFVRGGPKVEVVRQGENAQPVLDVEESDESVMLWEDDSLMVDDVEEEEVEDSVGEQVEEVRVRAVREWLQKVYGDDEVPEFEVCERSVKVLEEMRRASEERVERREEVLELYAQDLEGRLVEYGAESARLDEELGEVQWDEEVEEGIEHLVQVADVLRLNDTSTSTFMVALSDLQQEEWRWASVVEERGAALQAVRERRREAVAESRAAREQLRRIEDEVGARESLVEEWESSRAHMKRKRAEYKQRLAVLRDAIDKSQVNSRTTHTAIKQHRQELDQLQAQCAELQEQLQAYQDLPPDYHLAQLQVSKARAELQQLEAQVTAELHSMVT